MDIILWIDLKQCKGKVNRNPEMSCKLFLFEKHLLKGDANDAKHRLAACGFVTLRTLIFPVKPALERPQFRLKEHKAGRRQGLQ